MIDFSNFNLNISNISESHKFPIRCQALNYQAVIVNYQWQYMLLLLSRCTHIRFKSPSFTPVICWQYKYLMPNTLKTYIPHVHFSTSITTFGYFYYPKCSAGTNFKQPNYLIRLLVYV